MSLEVRLIILAQDISALSKYGVYCLEPELPTAARLNFL